MKKHVRSFLLAALVLPLTAAFSLATTVLMFPLWSWLESASGIGSVGHSGPAGWCYWFVFTLLLVLLAAAVVLRARIRRSQQNGMA
jgi:hypothetical membrane protein